MKVAVENVLEKQLSMKTPFFTLRQMVVSIDMSNSFEMVVYLWRSRATTNNISHVHHIASSCETCNAVFGYSMHKSNL